MTAAIKKPAGWRDGGGVFWTKSSAHSLRYRCKQCSREEPVYRGDWRRMHRDTCPTITPEMRAEAARADRSDFAHRARNALHEMVPSDAIDAFLEEAHAAGRGDFTDPRAAAIGFLRALLTKEDEA